MEQNNYRYYYKVPGLWAPKHVSHSEIHSAINTFIDAVPNLAKTLEDSFANIVVRRDVFLHSMETLIMLLKGVHARPLQTEAEGLLRQAKSDFTESKMKVAMKLMITDILSLSVEIQSAQHAEEEKIAGSTIELHASMIKNVSIVGGLIDEGEYGKAQKMTEELALRNPQEEFGTLLGLIGAEKHGEAKTVLNALREKCLSILNESAGVDFSKKILSVDDMPEILTFVSDALKSHYKVFGATSGQIALKVMEAQKPDLFILDIDMPQMNGYQLAQAVRSMADHAFTPIIFLTGNSSRAHIKRAVEVGGNDFIIKPTSHVALLTKVGKFLNKTAVALPI